MYSLTDADGEDDYVELSPMDMERIAQVELEHTATLLSPLKDPTLLHDSDESSDAAWMAGVSLTPLCATDAASGATTLPCCWSLCFDEMCLSRLRWAHAHPRLPRHDRRARNGQQPS